MIAETTASIPWTLPLDVDISLHPKFGDSQGFNSNHENLILGLFVGGSCRDLKLNMSQSLLDALYTRNGGESVPDDF